jgi:retron-type reverse transcriptase
VEAYRSARRNGGAPGIDGLTFEATEAQGLSEFLATLRDDLLTGRYQPQPNRRVDIPKENGQVRTLSIPGIRDRVVQGALKLILEASSRRTSARTRTGFGPDGPRTARWQKPDAVCGGGCPQ